MLDFIVNVKSGGGLGEKNLNKLVAYMQKNDLDFAVHITQAPHHATELAASLCRDGAKTIVAVGGDGTFHETLIGMDFARSRLGFIPSGRGNDFTRGIGLPTEPINALKVILDGKEVRLDYIEVGQNLRCLNIAGTGLDIDVLQRVAGRQGKITYLKSLLYCVRHFEPYDIEVTIDGKTKLFSAVIVGICNGTQFGGGLKLSPLSKADDGKLDLIIIKMPKNNRILPALLKFLRGKHLALPITERIECENVLIHPLGGRSVQLDGEIYDGIDLDCSIVKGGLRTFL